MGRNRVVVATLLVHSVNTATSRDRIKVMAAGCTECKGCICFPIHSDSPEAWEAREGSHRGPGARPVLLQGAQPLLSFRLSPSSPCCLLNLFPAWPVYSPNFGPESHLTCPSLHSSSLAQSLLPGAPHPPAVQPRGLGASLGALSPLFLMPTQPPSHPERLSTSQPPVALDAQERNLSQKLRV